MTFVGPSPHDYSSGRSTGPVQGSERWLGLRGAPVSSLKSLLELSDGKVCIASIRSVNICLLSEARRSQRSAGPTGTPDSVDQPDHIRGPAEAHDCLHRKGSSGGMRDWVDGSEERIRLCQPDAGHASVEAAIEG